MLWQSRRIVLAMRLFYFPPPKRACRMRATGHVAAVALDHGNSLRRRQPIARPHRGSFPHLQIDGNIRKL